MKLSIAIDMGAKNNGVFIAKSNDGNIVEKKATTVVIDKGALNFSKKSRRENRHRVRNYKRRKLAKRLLWEFYDKTKYTKEQQELIQGLFNNRGYTYLSIEDDFEEISLRTIEFLETFFKELRECKIKEEFLKILVLFENEEEVIEFCENITKKLDIEYKKSKSEAIKDFQDDWSQIKKDLKNIKELYQNVINEIKTGSKPRKTYLKEIKKEIEKFDFIDDKITLYNIVANISNLQLRILRKLFNSTNRYQKLKNYFLTFHYEDKLLRKELFKELNKHNDLTKFLNNTNPLLTIPPYEDMNNRNTYKCNSILIKQEAITPQIKKSIEILQKQPEFEVLKLNNLSDSQKLQRILDINSKIIDKTKHPREVFLYQKEDYLYYKNLLKENYEEFKSFAKKYYENERFITNGIFNANDIFKICKTNTPYKNNIKHILLKPIFSYDFSPLQVDELIEHIKNTRGLKSYLEKISKNAKEYQNSFYSVVKSCYEDKKCVADKEIKSIVTNLDKKLKEFQNILDELNIDSNLKDVELSSDNITKILNIFKQTYELLFKDINGFSKTCKSCSIENSIRSDENNPIAKRLLSDVAKPIDGMLDMLLDRLAFEIVEEVNSINDANEIEILLEQNRFEFEENLSEIKGKKNKRENKDALNSEYCAYTGEKFVKGDWDHIIPQSKDLRNSKANMIYVSIKGNRRKSNRYYTLQDLSRQHLNDIFKTDDLDKIREFIKQNLPKKEKFKNFDALKLKEQIALRYALFMRGSEEFNKAYEIVKQDKLKTITNGTQKRLARLIQEKLNKKLNKTLNMKAKVLDNKLVSATRKELAVDSITGEINHLWKEEKQDSHSHCIDAMVVFYLANQDISFEKIYLNNSDIKNITKRQTFIKAKDISSYKLFQDTIYSENYKHITKTSLKEKELTTLIKHNLLYFNEKNKKIYLLNINELQENFIYKIDTFRLSNLLFQLFRDKDKKSLQELKFLDNLRYNTTRVEIESIFFDEKRTKLLEFEKISKKIPPYSKSLYQAVYKKLQKSDIFDINENKTTLNEEKLESILKELFTSKQKIPLQRKRGKKRHKYTLAILGQNAKYRIYRDGIYQVVAAENIATKNYIINNSIKPIPYFTKNTLPLKISDLIDCLLVDKNTPSIYEVNIDISEIKEYISNLKYIISEAKRCKIIVSFNKNAFKDINFDYMDEFDCSKNNIYFNKFVDKYIENDTLPYTKYINLMRNNKLDKKNNGINRELKAKATLIGKNSETITLQYVAEVNSDKKEIILKNLK